MIRLSAILLGLSGCGAQQTWSWDLPPHLPPPQVPAGNPMNAAKVEMGRYLFYDTALSVDGDTSCATCHQQRLAFSDGLPTAVGTTGERHPRNSPSLTNVAYAARLNWANPLIDQLEPQVLGPLFSTHPVEMGMDGRQEALLAHFNGTEPYPRLAEEAFPGHSGDLTLTELSAALAAFQRTLLSADSPYDRYLQGQTSALTEGEVRGMTLFFSERLACSRCHGGPNFSDASPAAGPVQQVFHNTGLYNLDGQGAYPEGNTGLYEMSQQPEHMGKFKVPTLRNIAVTAPYMHDGSLSDLDAVLDHYAGGGLARSENPPASERSPSPLKSPFVSGFIVSEQERSDLLAFLHALTDSDFLTRPSLGNPWTPHANPQL